METLEQARALRDEFRRAAVAALVRHMPGRKPWAYWSWYLEALTTESEFDGLELWAGTWPLESDRLPVTLWCKWSRTVWNLEVAELASQCQEKGVANG